MRINQNVVAIQTQSTLSTTNTRLEKSIEKLSSGLRINRAADDAAGLAISEKLRRQVRGLNRAVMNAQDGISMIQTGEGALNESHSILQRMRELAIQAGNDTLTSNDRLELQKEVVQLRDDLNRISRNTEFNTKKLLDGSQTALISASTSSAKGIVSGATGGVGGDYNVSIALIKGGASQMLRTQTFTIHGLEPSILANGNTQLQSIAQFYDGNGVFALDAPKTLFIHGNNSDTSIQIDGQMTLDKLSAGIQNAIGISTGLDMQNTKVMAVGTAITGVSDMGGYIQITSGKIGQDGQLGFMSDQAVLNALGLSTTREAVNNQYSVNLTNGQGWTRNVLTESNRAVGLLNGIDVQFESQAAQIAGTQGIVEGIDFTQGAGAETFDVTVGTITLNVSLSGRYTMEGIARSINSQNLNGGANMISGLNATIVGGELRLEFTPKQETIDTTITLSNVTNDVLGLLNGTYSGFVDGSKDVTKVEQGWSRYVATTSLAAGTQLTVEVDDGVNTATIQLLVDTALGTLGTTNVQSASDMVRFIDVKLASQVSFGNSVQITMDQVGGSFSFTAKRVGEENNSNTAPIKSQVNMRLNVVASTNQTLADMFGFDKAEDIQTRGKGDTNFRIHVVDQGPQYQIGADQGQVMKVTFSDMSANALGVANIDLTSIKAATESLSKINNAIDKVSAERSKLGAFQNRLEYAINNLRTTSTNLTAAESRIRDTDVAKEMIEFTRNQIVSQAGNSMLAQANTLSQSALRLLQ